jgi:lipopolysaccharide transport system ATP-binding protein
VARSGVTFQHVWKRFRRGERHNALRDLLPALAKRVAGVGEPLKQDEFWALRDVSFEVQRGEALGIIGANGAGKSTILKLLTRIMRPTHGTCELRGRVGALIEVSAGFHQDLTGRENVFLQGALMGMKQAEIARKFDEIVAFSGIGPFIDTPVRRYSSGMNARLGFSIAAHLDPQVLIIDEVLAVGDYEFQYKAYERIQEIVNRDITVILVSHQLERVRQLCKHAVLLRKGEVAYDGPVDGALDAYLQGSGDSGSDPAGAPTGVPIRFHRLERPSDADVVSGKWAELNLSGVVVDASRMKETTGIEFWVRTMATGTVVFAVSSKALGVDIPTDGPFAASIELQMNVPPAVYIIEAVVKNPGRGKVSHGPFVSVRVVGETPFSGTVQMNPRIQIMALAEGHLTT